MSEEGYPIIESPVVPTKSVFVKPRLIISSPMFVKETIIKYVVYSITGTDGDGEISISRRYSEFKKLRNILLSIWGGTYIPPLPSGKFIGNLNPLFVEARRKLLERFLCQCAEREYIYCFPDFQRFLRNPEQFSVQKYLVSQVCEILAGAFSQVVLEEVTADHRENLQFALNNFKNSVSVLEKFKQYIDSCCEKLIRYQNSVNKFMTNARCVGGVYLQRNLLTRTRDMVGNQYWVLQDWVNSEIIDTQAIIEAIHKSFTYDSLMVKSYDRLESEKTKLKVVSEGKKSFMSIVTFKNKDESIKQQTELVDSLIKEHEELQLIRKIVFTVLVTEDIIKFVSNKSRVFDDCLREFSEKNTEEFEEFLSGIKLLQDGITTN